LVQINTFSGQKSPPIWIPSVIKMPKVNNHPIDENSPNLVALVGYQVSWTVKARLIEDFSLIQTSSSSSMDPQPAKQAGIG
jgi:hypothetical protein